MAPNETARRVELVEAIALIVLEDGLDALALRGLAARLSTSGRMLLYHFGTKDALVRAVLMRISEQMAVLQGAAASGARQTAGEFLGDMMQAGIDPATAPFMRVWTDVIVRAARGEAPYCEIADKTVNAWLEWIVSRLHPAPDNDAKAAAVLSIMEGITILELAQPGFTRQARRLLPALLDRC
ncbi:TetR family transcriptional regulator [Lichenicoccus sp.]|uniref:TetR family transcriptional regulator n=1 Tax=Lichenicoccus sp. TaxID=2781899 RepID=UPI003D13F6D0